MLFLILFLISKLIYYPGGYSLMLTSKSIVFIHGMFMNPLSWAQWVKYFEQKGYTCYAPAYPFHEGEAKTLRIKVNRGLQTLTLGQVVESISGFIDKLPEKPILVGHSMGGLVVQKLIGLDKAVAGVCIDSAPPGGINSFSLSFLKANLPVINPFRGNSVCLPSVKWFHYAFCNTMTLEQTSREFYKFVVPESRNIPRSSTKADGAIDFRKPHQPLLFIAGEMDHIIPASLNRKNFQAYRDPGSRRDFRVFAGRTHYICAQENWQEVAGSISDWLELL